MTAAGRPLLVLLPGLDGTGKLFASFIRTLEAEVECRIIGYPTDEPLGYEELAQRVRTALPRDRPYSLLGESFGGPIALRLAASAPPGLTGLVLCGTFAKSPYPHLAWARHLAFLLPIKSLPRWMRVLLMWGRQNEGRVPANAERAITGVDGAVVRRRIAALLTVDATESVARVAVPTLIVYSRRDRVVPRAATRGLLSRLPQAQVAAIDGPHLLLQACPAECAAAVLRFLRTR